MGKTRDLKRGFNNILAIDYGTKTIGLAVYISKIDGIMPLKSIKNTKQMLTNLKQIVLDYNIDLIIIGIPSNIKLKDQIVKFKDSLKDSLANIKSLRDIILINEDNSSMYTKDMIRYTDNPNFNLKNKDIKKKKKIGAFDAWSASIILERFLKCI